MDWVAVDMVRDMDKLCEKPTCIEEQIQGAVLVRRVRASKEWGLQQQSSGELRTGKGSEITWRHDCWRVAAASENSTFKNIAY